MHLFKVFQVWNCQNRQSPLCYPTYSAAGCPRAACEGNEVIRAIALEDSLYLMHGVQPAWDQRNGARAASDSECSISLVPRCSPLACAQGLCAPDGLPAHGLPDRQGPAAHHEQSPRRDAHGE